MARGWMALALWLGAVVQGAAQGAAQAPGQQGFAGLGQAAEEYAPVRRETVMAFPEDHDAHPAFRIEWWYVTATLETDDGTPHGVQWTLFRFATRPDDEADGWASGQLWMGHAAATGRDVHHAAERFGRGGVGQAGVTLEPAFAAWIDEWSLESLAGPEADPFDTMRLRAGDGAFAFDLTLDAQGPLVLHGEGGFSVKSDRGHASHYYSQPNFAARGTLRIGETEVAVTGNAWLDREWSSQPLDPDQVGWDWFSLSLSDDTRLMLYRLRMADGRDARAFGTWIDAEGRATPLSGDDITMEPLGTVSVAGRPTPVRWRIAVPQKGIAVETEPLNPQAWNALTVPYWEGPVTVRGSHDGRGYLEMTGY